MEIKTRKHFNNIIKSLTEEILDEEELDELTPNLYSFFKGYLEVFNEQYKKEESEIVKRTYEDVDISELFNEEHDNV